jgi:peroxiredoxin
MKSFFRISVFVFFLSFIFQPSFTLAQFPFFQNPGIGKPAPDFTLATLNGKDINMTQYRDGKNAIIFFWATWCPHCRAALRDLNQKREEIAKKEIQLILVDLGESENEVRSYVDRNKIGLEVFLDKEASLAEPYGIIGVPTFFFVDKKGLVKAVKHSLPENFDQIFTKSN